MTIRSFFTKSIFSLGMAVIALHFSSCSSAKKERIDQRDKLANSSGLFCDFVNGEQYSDVEVVLNLEMAKKCDGSKPFSVSHYRNASDVNGVVFCCSMIKKSDMARSSSVSPNTGATKQVPPASSPSNSNKKDSSADEVIAE